jgi:hypothetical protein
METFGPGPLARGAAFEIAPLTKDGLGPPTRVEVDGNGLWEVALPWGEFQITPCCGDELLDVWGATMEHGGIHRVDRDEIVFVTIRVYEHSYC